MTYFWLHCHHHHYVHRSLSGSEPRPLCVSRQFGVLLLAMTALTSSPITRWRIGSHTGWRFCYVQGWLLQSAVDWSTKVSYRQVAAGHECCSASCECHEEVRPRLDTLASLWAALARCGRSSHIQVWGDGVQVLAWPGTGLFVWAVYIGRSSCWTTASLFRQPPSTCSSTISTRYVLPSHLRCRWTNDMELVPKQFAWAGHANCLFSSYTEDVSFWSVLGTLSALEALFATMRYINWHLHYIRGLPLLLETWKPGKLRGIRKWSRKSREKCEKSGKGNSCSQAKIVITQPLSCVSSILWYHGIN